MNYDLKDKIVVTKEFLNDLEVKSWQEIEFIQAQIANLAENPINSKLQQLLKNLLTSYYIFTGGIEALNSEPASTLNEPVEKQVDEPILEVNSGMALDKLETADSIEDVTVKNSNIADDYEISDPFEYFVDFDEPFGEPISDEDLYGN